MNMFTSYSKKNLASEHFLRQIIGALLQWRLKPFLAVLLSVALLSLGLALVMPSGDMTSGLEFLGLNLVILFTIKTCRRLIDVFNLRKKYTRVTWSYITIFVAISLWIIGFLLIFNIKENAKLATAIGVIGTLLGWIFQDVIKGVVAFLHLRTHNLLKVGDWLKVDSLGVDGEVKQMTLTSVTVYNWDTTTSTISTSTLLASHFKNLENMREGKTYGRRMYLTFILDTGWFRTLHQEELEELQKTIRQSDQFQDIPEEQKHDWPWMNLAADEIKEGILNAQLYRLYIHHWLMNHPHISQQPRLIVRWMEQKESGMPLQVYAFITDSTLASFEWQQSQIVEHIIKSMDWFGLRLYQSPSAFDVSNSNIFLTKDPASYEKKILVRP